MATLSAGNPVAMSRSKSLRRARCIKPMATGGVHVNKGFSLLEWSSKLVPQGALVTGAKGGWRLAWEVMVRELAPQDKQGAYQRPTYSFSGRIGGADFPAEPGRYHLYLGNPCPWCHRVGLALALRGLSAHIGVTRLLDIPERATRGGWVMPPEGDPVFGAQDLWGVYDTASPGFVGRCTAPLLVDRVTRCIVSNESADIVRNLNELQFPGSADVDLRPPALVPAIDALNAQIYSGVNNAVYRSGFATSQGAYDAAQRDLWATLDALEARLAGSRFLLGDKVTEPDLLLAPSIYRFDAVYSTIFKCGRHRVLGPGTGSYSALAGWARDLWQLRSTPGGVRLVPSTVDIDDCRRSYSINLFPLNPGGVVPSGPTVEDLDLDRPHGRGDSTRNVFWPRTAPPAATQAGLA